MDNKSPKGIAPYSGGFLPEIGLRIKLIYRLMLDRRVSIFLKALPLASLVYLVLPEFFPVVDDAIVLWLGAYLFVELCPDDIVDEHMKKLRHVEITAENSRPTSETTARNEVVDAEFSEIEDK